MIHIFLVDDHKILRKGLKIVLELETNFKVVGEADSVTDAIDEFSLLDNVDVVLMGNNLTNESGLELIKYLSTSYPDVKSLVFSGNLACPFVLNAIELGASGYLTKNSEDFELVHAIKEVYAGKTYFSKTTEEQVIKCNDQKSEDNIQISPRELEVLKHIVEGWSNKMIGDIMYVSESTVNTHRYHIMKKLNAKNSADLVRIAFSKNLITSN